MLVCSHCQFENPNNHRFCQKCGTSLVDAPCSNCGTRVAFTVTTCPNCGTATGIRWRVLVAESLKETESEEIKQKIAEDGKYLDPGQRYCLLSSDDHSPLIEKETKGDYLFYEGMVIDTQPLQKSVLEVFVSQEKEKTLEQSPEKDNNFQFWQNLGIPSLALPYLKLKDYVPSIPSIHDAWQVDHQAVILLSDRPDWQSLSQLMAKEPLSLLQIIYWLKNILILWRELSPLHSSQTLLVEENMGIDEGEEIMVQQIYPDEADNPAQLSSLAKLWQKWLSNSLQCPSESLNTLLEEIATEKLTDVDQFYQRIENLWQEEQQALEENQLPGEALDIEDLPELLQEQLAEAEKIQPTSSNDAESDENLITSGPQINLSEMEGEDDQPTAVLPMKLLSLHDVGLTDTGRQRRHNEDFFSITTQVYLEHNNKTRNLQSKGLYIVCDGMGGHASGEVASAMAVETLTDYFQNHWKESLPSEEVIREGIFQTNQTLYNVNQGNASSGSGRMGTTLVMALLQDTHAVIAHVGDSRIYRVNRKWGLEQLTVDHEVGQRAIENGVDPDIAYSRPDAYQLTQAIGPHENHYIQPDIRYLHLQEDTMLLLCSDGLSDNNLVEDYWESYLLPLISANQSLEMGLQKLITLGNQKNGHDNITAILVRVKVRPDLESEDW
ncbi:MAG: serine/threonine phosphatase [Microcystaceae cyanobacterium]